MKDSSLNYIHKHKIDRLNTKKKQKQVNENAKHIHSWISVSPGI